MKLQRKFIITMLLAFVVVIAFAVRHNRMRADIVYAKALEESAMTINGESITLKELAFYVAYEEKIVQQQALVYDPENPNAYWNIHEHGEFVGEIAKRTVLEMAAHDIIFYKLAIEEGVTLSEEEEKYYTNEAYDFCSDLEEGQLESLGVTKDVLYETMRQIALANKYQSILCEAETVNYEDYNFNGDAYAALKKTYEIIVNEDVWDRVDVGDVTLDNY